MPIASLASLGYKKKKNCILWCIKDTVPKRSTKYYGSFSLNHYLYDVIKKKKSGKASRCRILKTMWFLGAPGAVSRSVMTRCCESVLPLSLCNEEKLIDRFVARLKWAHRCNISSYIIKKYITCPSACIFVSVFILRETSWPHESSRHR